MLECSAFIILYNSSAISAACRPVSIDFPLALDNVSTAGGVEAP